MSSVRSKTQGKQRFQAAEFPKKSKLLCLFCGGKSCSKENYLKNPHKNAIDGLHSDWITPEILAMQRPSTRIIKERNIIEQFKNAHIKAVFNLQLPGEHPYCGDGLIKESGFTYKPEDFTDHGIFYFNFGWTDMEITSNDHMIKILTHIDFIISQGMKISVHCHAGTGRTGLLIASWLIIKQNMKATEARELFRSRRVGGLSKSIQLTFLKNFEEYLNKSRISFQSKSHIKIDSLIQAQEKLVFGKMKSQSRYTPHIMFQILSRLEFLLDNEKTNSTQICDSFFDLNNKQTFGDDKWNYLQEQSLQKLKDLINQFQWLFSHYGDIRILAQILLDFFDQPNLQVVKNESALKLEEYLKESQSIDMVFADESMVSLLGRYEYSILSRFLVFIKVNFCDQNVEQTRINQFILRICISLLGKRAELDNLFIERSFLNTECFNPTVISLYQFLTAWLNEMIVNNMQDNSYFDRIFNRTACILEGKAKLQLSSSGKKNSKLDSSSTIKKSLQTRPDQILIGSHIKSEASENISRSEQKSRMNYTDIKQPLNSSMNSPSISNKSEIIMKNGKQPNINMFRSSYDQEEKKVD